MMTTLLVVSWIIVVLFALVQTARAWFWRWLALAWHAELVKARTAETRGGYNSTVMLPPGAQGDWSDPRGTGTDTTPPSRGDGTPRETRH
jgi:hypothetical protein